MELKNLKVFKVYLIDSLLGDATFSIIHNEELTKEKIMEEIYKIMEEIGISYEDKRITICSLFLEKVMKKLEKRLNIIIPELRRDDFIIFTHGEIDFNKKVILSNDKDEFGDYVVNKHNFKYIKEGEEKDVK